MTVHDIPTLQPKLPKPVYHDPFHGAAEMLADLCRRTDEGEPLTAAFVETFKRAEVWHAREIDERKAHEDYVAKMLAAARAKRAELDQFVQKLKAVRQRLRDDTAEVMAANPDLPWRDGLGRKMSLCKSDKMAMDLDLREKMTVSNVIDQDAIALLGIDSKFVKPVSFFTLDTKALRADLKAGAQIPWAKLETTKYTRGWEKNEDASTSTED